VNAAEYDARLSERATLGRALTLVESDRREHRALAGELLSRVMPRTGRAHRIGITGVPGAGKSTFIDALGVHAITLGRRVAVLAVDPTGQSGGSILGDKTRMARLARDERAFIRPSPSRGALGGVTRKTREAILICEAAGYDLVIVETVGVGQSEADVAAMVDTFVVLLLPNAGDELQGIKRGILELADIVAVTKADGDNVEAAARARADFAAALHFVRPRHAGWATAVLACSAVTGEGIAALWDAVERHRLALQSGPEWAAQRAEQQVYWLWRAIDDELHRRFDADPEVRRRRPALEAEVRAGRLTPDHAAAELLATFGRV
jgi:LAO/AO transport system kinase